MEKIGKSKNTFKLYSLKNNCHSHSLNIRAILNWSQLEWEDIRLSDEELTKQLKEPNNFEFNKLPVLEYKNTFFSQPIAIEIYLARKLKLMGANIEDEYSIMSLLSSKNDFYSKLLPIIVPADEKQLEAQENNLKDFLNNFLPLTLKAFESRIKIKEGKYALGEKLSLADFFYGIFLYVIIKHPLRKILLEPILIENAPTLNNLMDRLASEEFKDFYLKIYNFDSLL